MLTLEFSAASPAPSIIIKKDECEVDMNLKYTKAFTI